ncbi:MAG: secreted trypsin-like serine protease [Phenylobacterium sp.]|jgi:secreted trypsin-like serine protease
MKKIIIPLALGLSMFGANAADSNPPSVVGGHTIDISQAPYQVALINNSGIQFCGGTIIAKNWVVTAAHCLWGISPGRVTVVAGQSLRANLNNGIDVSEVHKYPGFYDTKSGKDIGLLKLSQDLDLTSPNITAIGYATSAHVNAGLVDPGVLATLTGWGKMGSPGSNPSQLQSVDMHLVSLADALAVFKSQYGIHQLTDDQLPAWDSGKSACNGDSGGPLVVPSGNKVILAGVVSWGKDCADIAPSMFARVSSFADWIGGIVGDIDQTLPPSVSISSPSQGDSFQLGDNIAIAINASAGSSDDAINKVSIYINNQLHTELYTRPYQFELNPLSLGQHEIKVVATDTTGGSATTSVNVEVLSGEPPVIYIVTPDDNQQYQHGDVIDIHAIAEDNEGTVAQVEFYQNNTLLSVDTTAPYTYAWQNSAPGNYQLTVVAVDNHAFTATSNPVNIEVKAADSGCSSMPQWNASTVYPRAGDQVAYLGNQYQNKWWTSGEVPSDSGQWGVWKLLGAC